MGARARAVNKIVDSNTLFPHLMMTTSTHFAYMDLYKRLLSNYCACPKRARGEPVTLLAITRQKESFEGHQLIFKDRESQARS